MKEKKTKYEYLPVGEKRPHGWGTVVERTIRGREKIDENEEVLLARISRKDRNGKSKRFLIHVNSEKQGCEFLDRIVASKNPLKECQDIKDSVEKERLDEDRKDLFHEIMVDCFTLWETLKKDDWDVNGKHVKELRARVRKTLHWLWTSKAIRKKFTSDWVKRLTMEIAKRKDLTITDFFGERHAKVDKIIDALGVRAIQLPRSALPRR